MKKTVHAHKKTNNKPHNNASTKSQQAAIGTVRIIGGQFKRRHISFIDADGLRPTPDRMRETLFNWLLADIHGARVLDSCAGSGVLGFEALSRGAAHCTFIELNLAQSKMLRNSAEQLQLTDERYHLITGAAEQTLNDSAGFDSAFDIVFIDPPYAHNLWQPILTALITQSLINTETLIYLEADKDLAIPLQQLADTLKEHASFGSFNGFECLKQTKVGKVVAGLYHLSAS